MTEPTTARLPTLQETVPLPADGRPLRLLSLRALGYNRAPAAPKVKYVDDARKAVKSSACRGLPSGKAAGQSVAAV